MSRGPLENLPEWDKNGCGPNFPPDRYQSIEYFFGTGCHTTCLEFIGQGDTLNGFSLFSLPTHFKLKLIFVSICLCRKGKLISGG